MKISHRIITGNLVILSISFAPTFSRYAAALDSDPQNLNAPPKTESQIDSSTGQELSRRISESLQADSLLSDEAKKTKVSLNNNGNFELHGEVGSSEERAKIESIAMKVAGSNRVENMIQLHTVTNQAGQKKP